MRSTSENLTSTKYIDPSRIEDSSNLQYLVMLEVELSSIMKKSLLITHLTSQAEIHCREAEFWRQITAAGDTSTEGIFLRMYTFAMYPTVTAQPNSPHLTHRIFIVYVSLALFLLTCCLPLSVIC